MWTIQFQTVQAMVVGAFNPSTCEVVGNISLWFRRQIGPGQPGLYRDMLLSKKPNQPCPPKKEQQNPEKRGWGEESSKQTLGTTQLGLAFSIPSIQATWHVTDLCLSEPPFPYLEDECLTAIYLTVLLAYIRYFKIKGLPRVLGTI